ncbi:MAG: phage head closure protein [Porphyromonadaceae bacterium]|nr:phage head closure protein [Porphyromonadaceae bacterium]
MERLFNPGSYRFAINILKHITGQDDYGDPLDQWAIFKTVRASKEPVLGNEFYSAQTTENKVEVKFNMRYFDGITSEMRIQHGVDIYEIVGPPIDVKSAHKELLCYCRLVK